MPAPSATFTVRLFACLETGMTWVKGLRASADQALWAGDEVWLSWPLERG